MEPKDLDETEWVVVGDIANGLWAAFRRENWKMDRAFAPGPEVRDLPPKGEDAARLTEAEDE